MPNHIYFEFLLIPAFLSSLLSNVYWGALSLGVKRPGREADHSRPSSAEVKNTWSYTSTPRYVFMTWCLVKHGDNFTFTLPLPDFLYLKLMPSLETRVAFFQPDSHRYKLTAGRVVLEK
jgi:hypothetical protein